MVANSGHDERGKYSYGQDGDQTGTEWEIRKWYRYSYGWNCVLRYPDRSVGKKIAELARASANNDKIGYNQADRLSFWKQLEKAKYNPSKIKTKCNADCSSGVTAIVKAVGFLMGISKLQELAITNYTGSMKPNFRAVGFEVLTDKKYLTSDEYLEEGDILLNYSHHTCINLDRGSKSPKNDKWVQDEETEKWWYQYEDGSYAKDGWLEIKDKWYYFDKDGWLLTDQYIKSSDYANNGKIYYVDRSGVWDDKIYKWEKDKKGWWFGEINNPKGYLTESWAYIDGKWYYFDEKGYMIANQGYPVNGQTYQFDKDGALIEE